jgi:uncharacterized protein (DUF2062 family)
MSMRRAGHMDEYLPNLAGHGISVTAIFLSWLGVLSPVMAGLATTAAFIYYLVNIFSSEVVQKWLKKRRRQKLHRLEEEVRLLRDLHKDD